jgi:hypothetical protein
MLELDIPKVPSVEHSHTVECCSESTVVHLSASQDPYLPMSSLYTTHLRSSICNNWIIIITTRI